MLTSQESNEILNCITIACKLRSPDGAVLTPADALLQAVRRETAMSDRAIDRLTKREREVFDLLAQGVRNREISTRLCISMKTVDTHRAHIMRKIGLSGNFDLVLWAVRHGML